MDSLSSFVSKITAIRESGGTVPEESYYGPLADLLSEAGSELSPAVTALVQLQDIGGGRPDVGLFLKREIQSRGGGGEPQGRMPERGVIEVKPVSADLEAVATSAQVRRYLQYYGKVLVTNLREFRLVVSDHEGKPQLHEYFSLASNENKFWSLEGSEELSEDLTESFQGFLRRVLLYEAPIRTPKELAWFLASYAKMALRRTEKADLRQLALLRDALERGLGLSFTGDDGERFFRSTLVQTLFYGMFSGWVYWARQGGRNQSGSEFDWRQASWFLQVPMVRALFYQMASPSNTQRLDVDELLDWAQEALARVDIPVFMEQFEDSEAVQYFYEPFLEAFDPEMRRELGVWYTPPEVVKYMVGKVHRLVKEEFGLEAGLADPNVFILDPATGTGSFLVEALHVIRQQLEEDDAGDGLLGEMLKEAVTRRLIGFEILPAPFVVAHLQVSLALADVGQTLDASRGERAAVFLTNALTGWGEDAENVPLPMPEMTAERDAATAVKKSTPVIVVLGNPPYSSYAGVSPLQEGGLVDPYKRGLTEKWGITRHTVDDLYVRFIRIAERKIVDGTGQGIVCLISNYSYLDDHSMVVMRQHLLDSFETIYIDALNGDSRRTGKRTPTGLPDPSVFSTRSNPLGIQVGTAIGTFVRTQASESPAQVKFRDFWGARKRAELSSSVASGLPSYRATLPSAENWFEFRPSETPPEYYLWPSITELTAIKPMLGLNENRGSSLFDRDEERLAARMKLYFDPDVETSTIEGVAPGLARDWSGFTAAEARVKNYSESSYSRGKVVPFLFKPYDLRHAYVNPSARLWNRQRESLVTTMEGAPWALLARRRIPRLNDGSPFSVSKAIGDQESLFGHAYWIPVSYNADVDSRGTASLLPSRTGNLSRMARTYLASVGIDPDADNASELVWSHVLAVGYSSSFVSDNKDGLRSDWARVPLPAERETLEKSADLGQRVRVLLWPYDRNLRDAVNSDVAQQLNRLARVRRVDGGEIDTNYDLLMRAGWGVRHSTGVVMPGEGRVESRSWDDALEAGFTPECLGDSADALLSTPLFDIYINESVRWEFVPQTAWETYIGGNQVLRKWLSYREASVAGLPLTAKEVRHFSDSVRRLTMLSLLSEELDTNYAAICQNTRNLTDLR